MTAAEQLARGLGALGEDLSAATSDKLLAYAGLLAKWNKVYNLTALRDESQIVSHHLLDSLSVLPHLAGVKRLADIGSGGGLPGIPLAIARPDLQVELVETSHKKAAFLRQATIELGLGNVAVHCARAETLQPESSFDAVISRAFSDLAEFVRLAGRLLREGGVMLAMKGLHPHEEIAQLPAGWRVRQTHRLDVPGLDAQRHLIIIEKDRTCTSSR
jgi:16S rRNA (guanine527-N7)-methyltransferase